MLKMDVVFMKGENVWAQAEALDAAADGAN